MSTALTRIYALQQRELNEKERQRQQEIAKARRIASAFNTSGIIDIFEELRDVPLRNEVRQRVYKSKIEELCWQANLPREKLNDLSFMAVNGCSSGPRWWCQESADTQKMQYGYRSGFTCDPGTFFDTPSGEWLDRFIEYLAAAAEPAVIANRMATIETPTGRRQMQPL